MKHGFSVFVIELGSYTQVQQKLGSCQLLVGSFEEQQVSFTRHKDIAKPGEKLRDEFERVTRQRSSNSGSDSEDSEIDLNDNRPTSLGGDLVFSTQFYAHGLSLSDLSSNRSSLTADGSQPALLTVMRMSMNFCRRGTSLKTSEDDAGCTCIHVVTR